MQTDKLKQTKKEKREFRLLLQDELAARCSRNPNYSLRSFAKFLSVSPAALSAILKGKRPITHKMKERLGLQLGLSLKELGNIQAKPHGNTKLNGKSEKTVNFQQI